MSDAAYQSLARLDRPNDRSWSYSINVQKGCSPDNSACEGFFGRLKNEIFYCRDWKDVSIDKLIDILDAYIHWYAEKHRKLSLNGMSPIQFRKSLGLIA